MTHYCRTSNLTFDINLVMAIQNASGFKLKTINAIYFKISRGREGWGVGGEGLT